MTYDIIISRYNECIEWVSDIDKKWNVFLYNKGEVLDNFFSYKKNNIGRESETYISHIIDNYENLADYNCFCQGHPFDHIPQFLEELTNYTHHDDFYAFYNPNGVYAGKYDGTFLECDFNGSPQHCGLNILDFCNEIKLKLNPTTKLQFTPGAQFIVDKKNILKHEKDFYINLREVLINGKYSKDGPYILERLWNYIF